jgi:hypothetical protein
MAIHHGLQHDMVVNTKRMQSAKGDTVARNFFTSIASFIPKFGFLWIGMLFLSVSLGSHSALAQQGGQSGQNSLLPEIDPQDIEIRGEFTARFPGLKRQPILGFNPTPRVYRIDPQRMPFMESGDQIIANLPVSELARPAAPDTSWTSYPMRRKAWLYGGYGMLGTAEVRGIYNERTDNKAWLADVGYTRSTGHLDNDQSGYQLGGVTLGREWIKADGRRSALLLDATYTDHDLFQYGGSPGASTTDWLSSALTYKGNKRSSAVDVTDWDLGVRWTRHALHHPNTDPEEQIIQGNFGVERSFAASSMNTVISWSIDGGLIQQQTNNDQSETVYQGLVGLGYERLADYNLQFYAGVKGGYVSDEVEGGHLVALPQLDITYWLSDRSHIRGFIESDITQYSPFDQRLENRFLGVHSRTATEQIYKGGGSFAVDLSTSLSVEAGAAYSRWQNKRYYVAGIPQTGYAGNDPEASYYQAEYADAHEFSVWGSVTYRIRPQWAWINAKAYLQQGELNDGGDIPYREKWGADLSLNVVPLKDFRIELWTNISGPRYDAVTGNDMDGFLLAGTRLEYYVSDQIGLYIKGQNLLDQQYNRWYGYQERPLSVLGGVTARF